MYLFSRAGRTRSLTVMAVGLAAAVITASALSPASGNGPETATQFSGTSSGAIVTSHNAGTGQAISASGSTGVSSGVIYSTTAAAGSTAIRGYASSTSLTPSYGVIGVSKNGYGVDAVSYSPTLAALFANNLSTTGGAIKGVSAGNAVTGISTKANGVVGQVSATPTPAPGAKFALAGVLGKDTSANDNNAGVAGTSTNGVGVEGVSGSIGVKGASTGGNVGVRGISQANLVQPSTFDVPGVLGTSVGEPGVEGLSTSETGVEGHSSTSVGVEGDSGTFTGVGGSSSSGIGVQGLSSSNAGVYGLSSSGTGVVGNSSSGTAVVGVSSSDAVPALIVEGGGGVATPSPMGAVVRVAFAKTQSCGGVTQFDIFTIDQKGDVKACGTITASTTPLVIQRTSLGQPLVSYASQQSQPTIEDFGQGRLVNGQAYVPLESRFAATIDVRANYLVFLTPRGDNRGLYVAQTTRAGFVVRESQGGRSTLAFDYRIVAKPYDTNAPRLPLASSLPHPRPVNLPALPRHQFLPMKR